MTLADRLAVFMEGEIRQVGRPSEVFARPSSVEVAAFIGSPPMNLLPARYVDGEVTVAGHRLRTGAPEAGSRDVVVGVRPSAVRIQADGIPARVELVEDLGDTAVLDLDLAGTPFRARVTDGAIPREGDLIRITARPGDIHLFDAASGSRL